MKLKLEVFREIVVLRISEEMDLKDIRLLQIGFIRLLKLNPRWLIIDLSHALLNDIVLTRFREIQPDLREKLSGLVLVGPPGELCSHGNLLDAFYACEDDGSSEAKFLIENYDLTQKMNDLLRKKTLAIEGELALLTLDERKAELSRLRRELLRLKKLQSFYVNDMVREAYHRRPKSVENPERTELVNRCHTLLRGLNIGFV